MKVDFPKAHGDKLKALLENAKLPASDKPKVKETIVKYDQWVKDMDAVTGSAEEILDALVSKLSEYKRAVEVDLIFDSKEDFLYRQKGQLKLDNTILEEFMPRLFDPRLVPGFARLTNIECSPQKCFSHMSFLSPFQPLGTGRVFIKTKNQDFAVSKPHRIVITDMPSGTDKYEANISIAYFATEIKTNLDKTMFGEISQTAGELKTAVPGARFIVLCEYLDMSPIDTKLSPIDEVIILRKAKRLNSNVRDKYSTAEGRTKERTKHIKFLDDSPLYVECFMRFITHLRECFPEATEEAEGTVLKRGYF